MAVTYSNRLSAGLAQAEASSVVRNKNVYHSFHLVHSGGPATSVSIIVQGSNDGETTWSSIGSAFVSTSSGFLTVEGAYHALRIYVTTLSGGTTPLVAVYYHGAYA